MNGLVGGPLLVADLRNGLTAPPPLNPALDWTNNMKFKLMLSAFLN